MSKIQIESGQSSSATHRLTQASTTLNRRYVKRPSNIAIEEAARTASRATATSQPQVPARPSRLVNLRVSAAALEAARAGKNLENDKKECTDTEKASPRPVTLTPNIVELGQGSPNEVITVTPKNPDPEVAPTAKESSNRSESTDALQQRQAQSMPTTEDVAIDKTPMAADSDVQEDTVANIAEPAKEAVAEASSDSDKIDTTLAMNIAADYAAASLGASVKEYGNGYNSYALEQDNSIPSSTTDNSVDAIARAASDAIASIRNATEPSEVSEQISSLKAFADNIKSQQSTPEMRELSNTIDKFIGIAMKSSALQNTAKSSSANTKVALSSKAHRAAAKVTKSSAKVIQANNKAATRTPKMHRQSMSTTHAQMPAMNRSMAMRTSMPRKSTPTISQREQALQAAMHSVATMESSDKKSANPILRTKRKSTGKRFAFAAICAIIVVAGVIGLITSNMPDISIRVAAMQTGIEASYPSYVPRDYSLGDINSEDGKITMRFNGPENSSFTLIEEKSSWDSSALLRNYVEPTWQENYTTTHEQGITIYIANTNSDAAWVNGGVLYKITSSGTPLTKKQVRSIVVSL